MSLKQLIIICKELKLLKKLLKSIQKADSSSRTIRLFTLVIQEGFEPPTHGLEGAMIIIYTFY